jgi:hypothetical protein
MLARFLSSADNLFIFRQYRYLQSRSLLYMQDELRELETALWRMDEQDRRRPQVLQSRDYADRHIKERKSLMVEIKEKLMEYRMFYWVLFWHSIFTILSVFSLRFKSNRTSVGRSTDLEPIVEKALTLAAGVTAMERPTSTEKSNLMAFFSSRSPLVEHEEYVTCERDLLTLRTEFEEAWMDRAILTFMREFHCRLWSVSLHQRTQVAGEVLTIAASICSEGSFVSELDPSSTSLALVLVTV